MQIFDIAPRPWKYETDEDPSECDIYDANGILIAELLTPNIKEWTDSNIIEKIEKAKIIAEFICRQINALGETEYVKN